MNSGKIVADGTGGRVDIEGSTRGPRGPNNKEVSHPVEGQRARQWQRKMQELQNLDSIYEYDAQPPGG